MRKLLCALLVAQHVMCSDQQKNMIVEDYDREEENEKNMIVEDYEEENENNDSLNSSYCSGWSNNPDNDDDYDIGNAADEKDIFVTCCGIYQRAEERCVFCNKERDFVPTENPLEVIIAYEALIMLMKIIQYRNVITIHLALTQTMGITIAGFLSPKDFISLSTSCKVLYHNMKEVVERLRTIKLLHQSSILQELDNPVKLNYLYRDGYHHLELKLLNEYIYQQLLLKNLEKIDLFLNMSIVPELKFFENILYELRRQYKTHEPIQKSLVDVFKRGLQNAMNVNIKQSSILKSVYVMLCVPPHATFTHYCGDTTTDEIQLFIIDNDPNLKKNLDLEDFKPLSREEWKEVNKRMLLNFQSACLKFAQQVFDRLLQSRDNSNRL